MTRIAAGARWLVAGSARLMQWSSDRVGLWRIDVIVWLVQAARRDQLAVQMAAAGIPGAEDSARQAAATYRRWARGRIPARAKDGWRRACSTG